ncbi:MAG: FISUMP domain-containing protein [Marinoscillum sp.]
MIKIVFIVVAIILSLCSLNAQERHGFRYQAIARSADGELLVEREITFRIGLLKAGFEGNEIYSEIHEIKTNKHGMVSLVIGDGTFPSTNFLKIDFSDMDIFFKVSLDENGGTEFTDLGISKLMAVPYALYSHSSGDGLTTGEQSITGRKTFLSGVNANLTGGVVLNNNTPEVAGAIRWNGKDFVGFNGSEWISLTAGGGAIDTTGNDGFICGGMLVDERNGVSYRTIQFGSQCWMKDNLNYKVESSFAGTGDYSPLKVGRYYTWAGAMNLDPEFDNEYFEGSGTQVHQGACPVGWHVPSHEEWKLLEAQPNVDGISLQLGELSGFDAVLAGDRLIDGTYSNTGIAAIFWTSTQMDDENAYKRILFSGEEGIGVFVFGKEVGFSLRCIKD